jgi:hypothetical protein
MKIIIPILIVLLATACGSDSSDSTFDDADSRISVLIKASGISSPIIIYESVEKVTYTLQEDGNFEFLLADGQTLFNFDVVFTGGQACDLSANHDLVCTQSACTADYMPVCAKRRFAGVECVTAPCETARYQTFTNSCAASVENAWFALDSECGALDEKASFDLRPVYITDFALLDLLVQDFTLISASIEDDHAMLELEVAGGCGTHDVSLYADNQFIDSDPLGANWQIGYTATDLCEAIIRIEETIDLLPLKEMYRSENPEASGEHSVILEGIGTYTFELPFD